MGRKRLPDDFKDFLSSLNKNNVEYLLVGGWAVGMYGAPRATADMDIFVAVDDENLGRLLNQASGIDFQSSYKRRKTVTVDGIIISIISETDLLKNKAASGREKDIADLRNLEGIIRQKSNKGK